MRIGKVKESILKRSVLRQLHSGDKTGCLAWGEDAGIFLMPEKQEFLRDGQENEINQPEPPDLTGQSASICVRVQINPVEGWTLAAQRAVYGAVNAVAAAGAVPKAMAMTVLMPTGTEEQQLKTLMKEFDRLCGQERITLIAGHTAVSPAVSTLVLSITAIGSGKTASPVLERSDRSVISTASAMAVYGGMDLIMVGNAGREGAALLAFSREEQLKSRYAQFYIDTAKQLYEDAGLFKAANILWKCGAVKLHDIREGGVFGALWELADAGRVGLDIDLKAIPIRQHTIEICEFFGLNPYMLLSGGCLLAACFDGKKALYELHRHGIEAEIIGHTTDGNDRLIRYGTEVRFLEPPKADEIYKVEW